MSCHLKKGDTFGKTEIMDVLEFLTEERVLHLNGDKWHWMNDAFPASNISLRSAAQENVVIIDQTNAPVNRVIGEMDTFSAMTLLHDEAIYLHQEFNFRWKNLIGMKRKLMYEKSMWTIIRMLTLLSSCLYWKSINSELSLPQQLLW